MASTINPSTIDPTKPEEGEALTANVRANEQATQDNFAAAVVDIEALQTGKADQTALDAHIGDGGAAHADATQSIDGFMTAADKAKLDGVATGANDYSHPNHTGDVTSAGDGAQTISTNAVTETKINASAVTTPKLADNAVTAAKLADMAGGTFKGRQISSGDPQDLRVENLTNQTSPVATTALLAQDAGGALVKVEVGNLPTGAGEDNTASNIGNATGEVFKQKTGVDLEFKTFRSSDSSVIITNEANTINLNATGAGGGEANDGDNLGLGEGVFAQKNGLNLEFKSLIGGDGITLSSTGAEITIDADAGGAEFLDNAFRINDNADPTAQIAFSADAINSTVRTISMPDQDINLLPGSSGTFAGINVENTFLESVTVNGQTTRQIPLQVVSSVVTANYSPVLRLSNQDNSAAGPDVGPALDFLAADSVGAEQQAAELATNLVDGTSGAFLAELVIRTNSGAGLQDRFVVREGMVLEGAAGGDIGMGTVNAFQYYKNGVVLGDGDVSKVDTPVDDQIAVWTGDGTVEGTTGLEYADRAKLSVEGAAIISTLKNAEAGGEQVYADSQGQLFTVAPPEQAWSDSATDTGIYGPQSGNTLGPWVQIPGLALTVGGDIAPGDRIDIAYRIEMLENGGHAGVVDVGFGIGVGVEPLPGDFEPHVVPADFAAAISGHQSSVNKTLSNGQVISIWFRIQSGTNPNFSVTANGAVSDHESFLGAPSGGGTAGGTVREPQTWAVKGAVADATLPGMFALKAAGETLSAIRVRAQTTAGGCTIQITRQGSNIAGATLAVTATPGETTFGPEVLTDGDFITCVVSASAGAENLSVTLELERAF